MRRYLFAIQTSIRQTRWGRRSCCPQNFGAYDARSGTIPFHAATDSVTLQFQQAVYKTVEGRRIVVSRFIVTLTSA